MFIEYKGRFGKQIPEGIAFMKSELGDFSLERLEKSKDMSETDGKEMSCEDFYEFLSNSYFFDSVIQDMKWSQTERTHVLMEMMVREADRAHVFLSDINEFGYDKFFASEIKSFKL